MQHDESGGHHRGGHGGSEQNKHFLFPSNLEFKSVQVNSHFGAELDLSGLFNFGSCWKRAEWTESSKAGRKI
jgi:hypothetical protein